MQKTARQSLIKDYCVPESLVRKLVLETKAKVQHTVHHHIEEKTNWRLKYLTAEEKRQELEHLIVLKEKEIIELRQRIEKQSADILKLRDQIFAESTERTSLEAIPVETIASTADPAKKPKGKQFGSKGFGRRKEQGLERIPEWHRLVSHHCELCGMPFADCPPEQSDEVDIEESVFVREHYRERARRTCRCPNEKVPRFVSAELPGKLIPSGKYSTKFWRFVIEEKFFLQRPLNRVITKLRFMGLKKISAGTVTNGLMIIHQSLIFEVMYLAIIDRNRAAGQWNMDDTGWKIFAEQDGSSHWHMWVSASIDTCIFVLDPERSNRVVGKMLKGVSQGIICADRHSCFKAFARRNEGFQIAFCWAHQRRDFVEMQTGYPELADWCQLWIDRINALFHQNKIRISKLDDSKRFAVEHETLQRMLESMEAEFTSQSKLKNMHTEQIARLTSLKEHWSGLTIFLDLPQVPMDNNEAERALRNLVVGRKNYYGSRSVWSGEFLAQLATIHATLERNHVDVRTWMNDYLNACAANHGNPPPDLNRFLPWNYEKSDTQPEALRLSLLPSVELQPAFAKPPPLIL